MHIIRQAQNVATNQAKPYEKSKVNKCALKRQLESTPRVLIKEKKLVCVRLLLRPLLAAQFTKKNYNKK